VRIEFSLEGGIAYFPGLNRPVTLEVEQLDAAAAQALMRRIDAARFFDLPAAVGTAPRGAADLQHVTLTIEDAGRRKTVRILVPVTDPALDALVRDVQQHVKAMRAARGPRAGPAGRTPPQ
jgi:emfourin